MFSHSIHIIHIHRDYTYTNILTIIVIYKHKSLADDMITCIFFLFELRPLEKYYYNTGVIKLDNGKFCN